MSCEMLNYFFMSCLLLIGIIEVVDEIKRHLKKCNCK